MVTIFNIIHIILTCFGVNNNTIALVMNCTYYVYFHHKVIVIVEKLNNYITLTIEMLSGLLFRVYEVLINITTIQFITFYLHS